MQRLFVWGWFLVLFAVAGCGQEPTYMVSRLAFDRQGWDTLSVDVAFSRTSRWGASQPLETKEVDVYLFNAAYDTLYAGDGRVVPIKDRDLGDRERLMVEVCGRFATMSACEQQTLSASPKRLQLDHDITFPEDAAFERGSYALRFVAERQGYGTEDWEPLGTPREVEGYLMAYVGDHQGAVKLPFSRNQGRFTLKDQPHYDDFQYYLKSMLMDQEEAPVFFDVYAGFAGQTALRLASVEKRVRKKTNEERQLEIRHFVDQAIGRLLERLDVSERDRPARVNIDTWTSNALTSTYLINVEVAWGRDRFILGGRYELVGRIEVEESGANARFVRQDANNRARRLWVEVLGGDTFRLGDLSSYVPGEEGAGREAAPPLKADASSRHSW